MNAAHSSRFNRLLSLPRPIFLDGGMGTMLIARKLPLGEHPEALCFTHPAEVQDIHEAYLRAGSDIVYTNSFGANPIKLHSSGIECDDAIRAAINIARAAIDAVGNKHACVALDIGPLGELIDSTPQAFQRAYDAYAQLAMHAAMYEPDLVALETMFDLQEMRIALLAFQEHASLPIIATMTFDETGRTFTGCTPEAFAHTAAGLGAIAVGVNCSLCPVELMDVVRRICASTALPVIVKPNAGLPNMAGHYAMAASQFAAEMCGYAHMGAKLLGGCCGTTPDFIARLHDSAAGINVPRHEVINSTVLCSAQKSVSIAGSVHIVGERINPTGKKRLQQALRADDFDYILRLAIAQEESGADILDVNLGLPGIDEPAAMSRGIHMLQSVTALPLSIDSSDAEALELGLRAYCGVALVNSVTGDDEVLTRVLPLVKKYGACVVALALNSDGIPETAERRIEILQHIITRAAEYGIAPNRIIADCLALTVSAQQAQAVQTLKATSLACRQLGLCTLLGVSNISFGLPERSLINRTFLAAAIANGLNLAIMNPNERDMTDTVRASNVIYGQDEGSAEYIKHMQATRLPATNKPQSPDTASSISALAIGATAQAAALSSAIISGLKTRARELAVELLGTMAPLELANRVLIPALDAVGDQYAREAIFLPQLLQAAAAARQALEAVRNAAAQGSGQATMRGKLILATVHGDIHDIGKSIVKIVLENYGYQVIDLGRDVPEKQIVQAAVDNDVKLIGLSALMTTTVASMRRTIGLLRASGHECKVMVGGAALTQECATEIGADFYAEDARASVRIAQRVLGEDN